MAGGAGNTESVIGDQTDPSPRADCDAFKPFWIQWTSGTISVGEGYMVGAGHFLSYTDPGTPTPVNRFMITTDNGFTGVWNLGKSVLIILLAMFIEGSKVTFGYR